MKKTIRNLMALVMVFAMLVSLVPAFAAEASENGKVEIAFKLGDNILTINGKPVEVETPYAVGVGVTLVPVRVITEAFGANVGWDNATKSIPIEYEGVKILLQIGNPIAEVNGTPEALLAPPEISGQSTMVPLRFISETFGAVVGYDNATGSVTVTKGAHEEGSTVEGGIESLRIGDSYYGWSMDNPSDYTIDRGFDGSYTYFEYDVDGWIGVLVDRLPEDYSFEEDFSSLKSEASEYTLVAAQKDTNDPTVKKAYIKYKDKVDTVEEYIFVANGYRFNAYYIFTNDHKEEQQEAARILTTFKPKFTKDDTHDLSTVKNGYIPYTSKSMNISFDIPVDFTIISNEDVENDVTFGSVLEKDRYSLISFCVYSKSEVGSAQELCNKDQKRNKLNCNEEISNFSTPKEVSYGGFNGYAYTYSFKSESIDTFTTDTFFEVGDYTYNIGIEIDNDSYKDAKKIIQNILNSVKATPLDPEETGILMRYEADMNTKYTIKGDKWSVKVPESYEKQNARDEHATVIDRYTGTVVSITVKDTADKRRNSDLIEDLKNLEEGARNDGNCKVVFQTQKTTAGIYTYNTMAFKTEEKDAMAVYTYVFNAIRGSKEITMMVIIPEISYSLNTRSTYADIAANIVIEP